MRVARRERAARGRDAQHASGRQQGVLPRARHACRPRDRAKRQQSGFGAMVSFELKGALEHAKAFLHGAAPVLAGGVARRRREPGRSSGQHDARGDGDRGARGRRDSLTAWCACRSASSTPRTCCATCRTASTRWVSFRRASHAAGNRRRIAPCGRDFATLAVHVVRACPVGESSGMGRFHCGRCGVTSRIR